MSELHLLIIWSKGLYKKEKIISDIKTKFDILRIYNIKWSVNKFSENLSRFYSENLPKNSSKERHCGNGVFTCILVKDNNPIYEQRKTSRGYRVVNVNLFDSKQLYRKWTGGGHKIHATDDISETKIQLAILFGFSYDDFLLKEHSSDQEIDYDYDLMGAHGWNSFEELFKILNLSVNYVILRNFLNLEEQLNVEHPDVDLLIENKKLVIDLLNAKPTTNKPYRTQYNVLIKKRKINFDLRYVGDNYYDSNWEIDILNTKKVYGYLFIPNDEMLLYSLIYHSLIHKENISLDYINTFKELFTKQNIQYKMSDFVEGSLLTILLSYMKYKNYNIVEPYDLTVGFNNNILSKKIYIRISKERMYRLKFLFFIRKIKFFYKIILNKIKQ